MDIELTKEADALLCVLYKAYLEKRENGLSKVQAKSFGSSLDIQESLTTRMNPEDTDETCWELHRSGMVNCYRADCIAYTVQLNDEGIIYMENRFKNGLNEVLNYLAKIKDIIPFI